MRKLGILWIMIAVLVLSTMTPASMALAGGVGTGGVATQASAESATGYRTTFTYTDDKATNVQLMGGFQYYVENDYWVLGKGFVLAKGDTMANHLFTPETWSKDLRLRHVNDVGYVQDMEKDVASGAWSASVDLPGGSYLYQFNVSYDGGANYEAIVDPANVPGVNALGANQNRSQFYVPHDAAKQSPEDDWGFLLPVEDESLHGSVVQIKFTGADNNEQQALVYLPANYDENRAEPYKTLYLSHGGGGEQGDWFHQGNAINIVERLVGEGKSEEFVIVCMNNSVFTSMFEDSSNNPAYFEMAHQNISKCLVPYIQSTYHVSDLMQDRAFVGLSNGAKLGTVIYVQEPELFGYVGLFSGSAAWYWKDKLDYSAMKVPNVYLGAGFADQLIIGETYHMPSDKTLLGLKELLDKNEITYNNGGSYVVVQGGHDWFTWPQLLRDYVETTLWK